MNSLARNVWGTLLMSSIQVYKSINLHVASMMNIVADDATIFLIILNIASSILL